MNKIYYNPTTGDIDMMVSGTIVTGIHKHPFIEIDHNIRICDWKVDLETLELIPQVSTRPTLHR